MKQSPLTNLLLDQTKDLVWMINLDLQLIYANKSYQNLMKEVAGVESKLNESVFVEGFGEGYIEKWKIYYERAIKGQYFEIEEQYFHIESNEIRYSQNSFNPLTDDDGKIIAVACQSRDITAIVKQRSEANQMMDASLDVFCTINEMGNFVYVSAAALNHWGYLPEELIGKPYKDMILEADIPKTNEIDTAIFSGKEIKSFVNRYKKKDGSIAYNLWSARWDDTAKLMYCVARDGKEKIEQEELILQSEQRFKALVQEGSDLIGILDAEGNYTYVSPTSYSILGIKPEEFIGRNPFEFIHPDDLERTLASLEKITSEKIVIVEPFRFQNDKKEWRWVETVLTNMLENPAINGIVANSRDVTDKIEEKNKLKLFENVITNTKDAILITEAEPFEEPGPKIIYVNDAFTQMTGYQANEIIGKTPRILQGINSNRTELAKIKNALKNWESDEITIINYKKNGEEFWVNFSITPVTNVKGRYTHWIAVERDVTEQKIKELEKELLTKIINLFNKNYENDLKKSLTKLCEEVAKFGDFDFAEMWLPAIDGKKINLISNFFENQAGKIFHEATQDIKSCNLGEGMAGYVWENKKIEIWGNIEGKWLNRRKVAAKKAGIKAMMGVPLKHKDEVIGILLLGTEKTKSELIRYSSLLQKLESTIGAELSRKKIEIELAQIFDFTPDMICVAGFDGYLKRINPAGLELLGYSKEEMLSEPIRSFIYEQDRAITKEKQLLLYSGGRISNFENRYVTKQGEIVWLSWTATSAPEQGIVYSVAKNITEEKKLRELNRQVGDMVKIGIWEIDLVNETVFWSDEVHHIHGTDPKSYIPNLESAIQFYRKDFRKIVRSKVESAIAIGEQFDFEAVLVTKNNKEIWIRSIGNAAFENGKCIRVYGGFQDIDERKKIEIKLAESENRFRTILEAEPECIKLLGPSGEIMMMNPAGLVMIEAENEEQVLGKSVQQIILPEHRIAFSKLTKSIFKGESGKLIFEIKGLKGTRRWLETHAVPMKNEKGQVTSLLGVTRDITERKEAEQEKNNLLNTLENSLNEIYIFDAETLQFSYVNKGALHNLGYTEEEIKTLTPLDIKPDFTETSFKELVSLLVNNEKDKIIFFTNHKRKDASIYPVEVHLQLVTKGNNKIFLAIILDITDRKIAEENILKANERFEKVTEATNDAIWDWDIINDTFYRSKAVDRFFGDGASKTLIQNDFWKDNFHPDDLILIKESIKKALENPSTNRWELEYRVINTLGEIIYVIDRGIIVRNYKGKAIRMVGAMTNITEQKKSDEENRFKANLLSIIGQAAIATNLDGIVNYWNKAAENIYGWNADEAIGQNIVNLTTPDINIEEAMQIMKIINKGEKWSGQFNVQKKDGTNFPAQISNSPIYDEHNILSGIIGISSDITEEVKNKELLNQYTLELERSNEELEQFAFVASHDLQEPLRMISSFMDLLQRKYGDLIDEKGHEYIYFATDGAKRMKQIILDLLEYSRTNKPAEGKEKVDINEIVSEFNQLRRKLISEKNATVIAKELPILYTNKAAITQVLHCILDNALKYSKNGTPPIVEISNVDNENEWEFSIKDNGIGIDPEFYEKIFVIFQRLHNRDKYEGTGIGLSIAKRHIQFIGGRIWLESVPGEGTIFYFTIPKM